MSDDIVSERLISVSLFITRYADELIAFLRRVANLDFPRGKNVKRNALLIRMESNQSVPVIKTLPSNAKVRARSIELSQSFNLE